MSKYYLFYTKQNFEKDFLSHIFKELSKDDVEITFLSDFCGYFFSDRDLYLTLDNVIKNINLDLNIDINVLITHKVEKEYFSILKHSFNYFKNKAMSLYELLLTLNLNGDTSFNNYLLDEFKDVPTHLIDTCKMYLEANQNAILTAKSLFIHRNTFNQRLEKFVELTSLDIRDFYNASYFLLYLKLKEKYVQSTHMKVNI